MESTHSMKHSETVIAKALNVLRQSGFTAAAEKLEEEFDDSASVEGQTVDINTQPQPVIEGENAARTVKRTERRAGPCSTSSLESCGVLSGPVASSGPSQCPSPSQALVAYLREPTGGRQGTGHSPTPSRTRCNPHRAPSSAHDDVGYIRIPVTNQAWFETHELRGVVVDHPMKTKTGARRSPYHLLPRNYFQQSGNREESTRGSTEDSLAANPAAAPMCKTLQGSVMPTGRQSGAGSLGAHRRSQSEHRASVTPSEVSVDSAPGQSKHLSSTNADGIDVLEPSGASAGPARQAALPMQGSRALRPSMVPSHGAPGGHHNGLPHSASASSLDAIEFTGGLGDSGSMPMHGSNAAHSAPVSASHSCCRGGGGASAMGGPVQPGLPGPSHSVSSGGGGLKPQVWLGSYDSLWRPGQEDSSLLGDLVAEANDPPDAPEDAAVFMHDISHGAWHMFTKHVAKEAASLSGSSFQTTHHLEAAHEATSVQAGPPNTIHSITSHPSTRHDSMPHPQPYTPSHPRSSATSPQAAQHLRRPSMKVLSSPFQSAAQAACVEPPVVPISPSLSAPVPGGVMRSVNVPGRAHLSVGGHASLAAPSASLSTAAASASTELPSKHSRHGEGGDALMNFCDHNPTLMSPQATTARSSTGLSMGRRSMDALGGSSTAMLTSSMSDFNPAFNAASADLPAPQRLQSASGTEPLTQAMSPPGTPPPDADDGSAWDSCQESVSVAGRSHASAASIDGACGAYGAAGAPPGAADSGDPPHLLEGSSEAPGQHAADLALPEPAPPNAVASACPVVLAQVGGVSGGAATVPLEVGRLPHASGTEGLQGSHAGGTGGGGAAAAAGDGGPAPAAMKASSTASTEGVAIRREASLCIDVGGCNASASSHWGLGATARHVPMASTASSGSFHADRVSSDAVSPSHATDLTKPPSSPLRSGDGTAADPPTGPPLPTDATASTGVGAQVQPEAHPIGTSESQPGAPPGLLPTEYSLVIDSDAVHANFTAWRSVSEPVGDPHQWWGPFFSASKWASDAPIPGLQHNTSASGSSSCAPTARHHPQPPVATPTDTNAAACAFTHTPEATVPTGAPKTTPLSRDGSGTFWKKFSKPSLDLESLNLSVGAAAGVISGFGGPQKPARSDTVAPANSTQCPQGPKLAAWDDRLGYNSVFATDTTPTPPGIPTASMPVATGAPAQYHHAASSPASSGGIFSQLAKPCYSSSARHSSESGAGPMAWQASQQSLQGHGSVTAGIPDPGRLGPAAGAAEEEEVQGQASRAHVLDAPAPAEPVSAAAGAMQRGAGAVAGLFGKAAQYTGGLYNKIGRSQGSLGNLSADCDAPEAPTGPRSGSSSPKKSGKEGPMRALLSGLRRHSRQPAPEATKSDPPHPSTTTNTATVSAEARAALDTAPAVATGDSTRTCTSEPLVASAAHSSHREFSHRESSHREQQDSETGATAETSASLNQFHSHKQCAHSATGSGQGSTPSDAQFHVHETMPTLRSFDTVSSYPAALRTLPAAMAESSRGDHSSGTQVSSGSTGSMGVAASHGEGSLPMPPVATPSRPAAPVSVRDREVTSGHDADDEAGSPGGSSDGGQDVGCFADAQNAGLDTDGGDSVTTQDWPSFKFRRDVSGRSRQSRGSAGTGGAGSAHSTPRSHAAAAALGGYRASNHAAARTGDSGGAGVGGQTAAFAAWFDDDSGLRQSFTLLHEANREEPAKGGSWAAHGARGSGDGGATEGKEGSGWKGLPALDLDLGVAQQDRAHELMPLFSSRLSFDSNSPTTAGGVMDGGSRSDPLASTSAQNAGGSHPSLRLAQSAATSGRPSSAPPSEHAASEPSFPACEVAPAAASTSTSRQPPRGRARSVLHALFPWRESDMCGRTASSPGSASDDNPVATSLQTRPYADVRDASDPNCPGEDLKAGGAGGRAGRGGGNTHPLSHPPSSPWDRANAVLTRLETPADSGSDANSHAEENVESEPSAFDLTECEYDSADAGDNAPFLLDLSPHNVAISDADSPTVGGPLGIGGSRHVFLSDSRTTPHAHLPQPSPLDARTAADSTAQDQGDPALHDMHAPHASIDAAAPVTLEVARPVTARASHSGASTARSATAARGSPSAPLPRINTSNPGISTDPGATSSARGPPPSRAHRSSSLQPTSHVDSLTAQPPGPATAISSPTGSSRPTQRSVNLSSGEPDLAAALHSPRRPTSWSPSQSPFPTLSVSLPTVPAAPAPNPTPLTPSGEGGFLPLDDKPEQDAEDAAIQRPDTLQSSDAAPSSALVTEGTSGYLTEPFPNSSDASFQLQPFPSTSGQLDDLTVAAAAPLWQSDAISNLFSAASGSTDLKDNSASWGAADPLPPQVDILDLVEPLATRQSSSANLPSSPNAVTWGARSSSTTGISLPSVSTVGSPAPLAAASVPASGASPTATAGLSPTGTSGLLRPLQPIITAPAVSSNPTALRPIGTASPSLRDTASAAADATRAANAELAALHAGHWHQTPAGTTPPSSSPNWSRLLMDGPSHFSSLQSSPALSQRSPSALGVTPTGSSSSLRHDALSPQRVATPSGATTPASPVPPPAADYDPREPHEVLWLPIFHRSRRTGLEGHKEFVISVGDVIGQRYTVTKHLGHAAFSRAVAASDAVSGTCLCLKVIRSNKDFFDQSLDEIKLLQMVNKADTDDQHGIVRLHHFFYWREHLVLATELLHINLYQCSRRAGNLLDRYFTMHRIKAIAKQVLKSLVFLHSLDLIHCDLKPENIMIAEFELPKIKIIDLGSSCFKHDRLATYVQSRSYRAPEVILKAGYDGKIDVWSLGAILAELLTGTVLFAGATVPTMLARISSICGPLSQQLLASGRASHHFYTCNYDIWERDSSGCISVLRPALSSIAAQLPCGTDPQFVLFLEQLLKTDPAQRPTAEAALQHPWLL